MLVVGIEPLLEQLEFCTDELVTQVRARRRMSEKLKL